MQITYVRKNGNWVAAKDQWGVWKYAYNISANYSLTDPGSHSSASPSPLPRAATRGRSGS